MNENNNIENNKEQQDDTLKSDTNNSNSQDSFNKDLQKKLEEYKSRLDNEKFVLSLVHYSEWNNLFLYMNKCGINKINDSNKQLQNLEDELKQRELEKEQKKYNLNWRKSTADTCCNSKGVIAFYGA